MLPSGKETVIFFGVVSTTFWVVNAMYSPRMTMNSEQSRTTLKMKTELYPDSTKISGYHGNFDLSFSPLASANIYNYPFLFRDGKVEK